MSSSLFSTFRPLSPSLPLLHLHLLFPHLPSSYSTAASLYDVAVLCPGQGAQATGMAADLFHGSLSFHFLFHGRHTLTTCAVHISSASHPRFLSVLPHISLSHMSEYARVRTLLEGAEGAVNRMGGHSSLLSLMFQGPQSALNLTENTQLRSAQKLWCVCVCVCSCVLV